MSATALLRIGVLYGMVIVAWLLLVREPSAPIGDPYLVVMEILTIGSGLALIGVCAAVACLCDWERRVYGLMAVACGTLAAGVTMAVHFANLTAVRQLWRAGAVSDYRLIWPSALFAVEYLAWDILVGATMLLLAASLGSEQSRSRARAVLFVGGACCLIGVSGPASGRMLLQNIAVFGYAVLLPVAAYLMARVFGGMPPSSVARSRTQ